LPAAARGGLTLYLEAFTVASVVSGLIPAGRHELLAQTVQREAKQIAPTSEASLAERLT
jgi:hypothetical protein